MRALALTLLLLLLPAPVAGASGAAARHAKASLVACDTAAGTAMFRGSMATYGGARTLQMRFTLQARVPGGGGFKRVAAPGFDTWLSSAPGKKGYVYDKTVQNLEDGDAYRAVVRFRWKDPDGTVLGHALKVTVPCLQPDNRPNLRATKVTGEPGPSAGTGTYTVRVANKGRSAAPVFATALSVDGKPRTDATTSEPLAAHGTTEVSFTAPLCDPGATLTVTVDTGGAVDETVETDNVLAVPCPA